MPKVSIVILNWNGRKFLQTCLSSLAKLRYPSFEIIVVDNNSSDDSVEFIHKKFPKVKVVASKVNNGFARGNNIGARVATGKYLLFLNNDTKVTPNFLTPLVAACERDNTIGCVQPEMRVMKTPELLDEAGAYLTPSGFLYHYGYRKKYSKKAYQNSREVFSAKGACIFIPKHVFDAVGEFDEDFFIFFEETDLCHRIWLAGYRVLYMPASHIYHVAGGDTTDTYSYVRRIYLTFKNMNYSYIKNFGTFYLFTVYPVFVIFQIGLLIFFLLRGKFREGGAMLRGWWWNMAHVPETLQKRRHIQHSLRKVSDIFLNRHIFYAPGLFYYYCILFDAKRYQDTPIGSSI